MIWITRPTTRNTAMSMKYAAMRVPMSAASGMPERGSIGPPP